jgi:hypothetical protein
MIPNDLHYIHLSSSGRSWKLHHYLSVKSAVTRSGVDKIYVWIDAEPDGHWWDKTKPYVECIYIEPPHEIFGIPVIHPAHKSDVLRLQILLEHGGIYVDTDTIFVKSFNELLDNNFVLGQQGINGNEGLCPAVILSQPQSKFAQSWLMGFKDHFHGGCPGSDTWCTHSVYYPSWLSSQYPDEVTILNHEAFFWPLYHDNHIKSMFCQNYIFPNAYSHHLWESSGKEYLDNLTEADILTMNTTFSNLVKDLL